MSQPLANNAYWKGPWPAEDGGPERLQAPTGEAGPGVASHEHFELLANRHALERLAGFQGGQRAFEPGEIKQCHSHGLNMTKESVQVNQL